MSILRASCEHPCEYSRLHGAKTASQPTFWGGGRAPETRATWLWATQSARRREALSVAVASDEGACVGEDVISFDPGHLRSGGTRWIGTPRRVAGSSHGEQRTSREQYIQGVEVDVAEYGVGRCAVYCGCDAYFHEGDAENYGEGLSRRGHPIGS